MALSLIDVFPRGRWRSIAAGGAIVVLVLVAYLPALRGGFVWDDDSWTVQIVGLLRDAAGLRSIWFQPTAMQQYYPLSGTTFWLDYHLWKFWPVPYHVENVLLHALAAVLFWRSLRRLGIRSAWLASAVFALHPMMVESAAWITERKNVLSLVLCLAAFLAYPLRWADGGDDRAGPIDVTATADRAAGLSGRRSYLLSYFLAWFLFVAALLAKTVVCSLPAIVLLLTWWRLGRLRWRQDVLPTLPFFAVALGMCALTAWLERSHVGAQGGDYALSLAQRCLIAGRAFWFYLGKLIWPANLCFVYPRWQPDARDWGQWLYPLTALGLIGAVWLARGRIGRGPVAALFFYVGTLSPVLGFVNVYFMRYSFVCDHWAYLPSLGPIALAAAGIGFLVDRGKRRSVGRGAAALLVLTLGILTWRQAIPYADLETMWRTTISRNPASWIAHSNLGNALVRRGEIDEAIGHFQEAIRLKPDLAEAYTSLAVALGMRGEIDAAIETLERAIRLKPDYAEAHYDLGIALEHKGRPDAAIGQFQEAIRLKPGFVAAQRSLAHAVRRRRQRGDAAVDAPR
jgi:tetratricopeptide (TPR) repeat protein